MRVLITGVSGLVVSHLAELYLAQPETEVYGLIRNRSPLDLIRRLGGRLHLAEGDVADPHAMDRLLSSTHPDLIHHLGGQSFVPFSTMAPAATLESNLIGSLNLFEAALRRCPQATLQVASSSEVYGIQEVMPITENHLPNPLSSYAVSMLAMDRLAYHTTPANCSPFTLSPSARPFTLSPSTRLRTGLSKGNGRLRTGLSKGEEGHRASTKPALSLPKGSARTVLHDSRYQYVRSYGLKVVVTRAFNDTGPRRGLAFVTSSFARQIAEIERSGRDRLISVGNIEAERDWTDVRDVVRAYALSVQRCLPGEPYNIASGRPHKVSDLLKDLLALSAVKASIQVDPERNRPSDVPKFCGDSAKFRKPTGWEPKIPWEKTLRDFLDYWRLTLDGKVWQPDKLAP